MKNKKLKFIINLFTVVIILFFVFSIKTYAINLDSADNFIKAGGNGAIGDLSKIKNPIISVGQILVTIASVSLAVISIIIGIKYMICDSADKKAKLKTQLIGLVVSTIVIAGAHTIWLALYETLKS